MGYPGMDSGEQGIGFGEPGFDHFIGEEGAIPAQGDCVDLSSRIYLDCHQLGSVLGGKLESGEEGSLTIRCTLCEQGTFWLGHSCIAVVEDHVNTILGVPGWGLLAMGMVTLVG